MNIVNNGPQVWGSNFKSNEKSISKQYVVHLQKLYPNLRNATQHFVKM